MYQAYLSRFIRETLDLAGAIAYFNGTVFR
jgi:hypothetical protein